jgi:hypothetical protein
MIGPNRGLGGKYLDLSGVKPEVIFEEHVLGG